MNNTSGLVYLADFLKGQGYVEEDMAVLLSTYQGIEGDIEALSLWQEALALYAEDENCDYQKIISLVDRVAEIISVHPYTTELLICIFMAPILRERYIQRGLEISIFEDTVKDLRYKMKKCKGIYGVVGFFSPLWFAGFFNLTRFCLGRLQFEVVPFGARYEKNGHILTEESKVVNVHIPANGEPLTDELCFDAYKRAKRFFFGEGDEPCAFVCDSWLLFPEHEHLLSPSSNIYRFYKSYDIISFALDKDGRDLWRIFGTRECNPDRLPGDNSLRRAYIDYLKSGRVTGSGKGVLFI